jgi:hypothetical protein
MEKYMMKLPEEIVDYIIPYTYKLQNKYLLDDIKNFSQSKTEILQLYYVFWILYMEEEEPQDQYWLVNDLIAYINNYNPTMNGYIKKFYSIFRRNLLLQTNQHVENYVSNLEKKEVVSQINILLGLLMPHERVDLIGCFSKIHNIDLETDLL